jgi:hypothetical protein
MTSRRRLAVGAGVVLVLAACGSSSQTRGGVPSVERQRIVAEFGKTYLPGFMPRGFIFIRWESRPGSYDAAGKMLFLEFGDHGRIIEWSTENSQDPDSFSHDVCATRKPVGKPYEVGGRQVFYNGGAVGQDSVLCLPSHRAVVAWNDYSLSRAMLNELAASAQAVG